MTAAPPLFNGWAPNVGGTYSKWLYPFIMHFTSCYKVTQPVWYIITVTYIYFLKQALVPLVEQIWHLGQCGLVRDLMNGANCGKLKSMYLDFKGGGGSGL